MNEALDIHVKGIVQGVGFRPFVYKLAKKYLINGWVLNATDGVHVHAEGESAALDGFVMDIADTAPAAARVEEVNISEVALENFDTFEIRFSDASDAEATTLISPDLATCDDCVDELFDPNNRRYHYPFINCTNCGPRFTIIDQLPYDRKHTSMKQFPMCDQCAEEYGDPLDRRFHAQPDACFACGPVLRYAESDGFDARMPESMPVVADDGWAWGRTVDQSDAIIERAVSLLRAGKILAVKGLGGFHLVCDAENPAALVELRRRKHRRGKAFAVMAASADAAKKYATISAEEEAVLKSPARPIVLLRKRVNATLAEGLADGLPELGMMLPATPLQHLLMRAFGGILVMTSGNVHGEPIQTDDGRARETLGAIADAFIGNNRAILSRYDDSVVRLVDVGEEDPAIQMIRRARGYAPLPTPLTTTAPEQQSADALVSDAHWSVFATGPEQKNTFCFTRAGEAFVSQHIGDMENVATNDAWLQAEDTYRNLLKLNPTRVACDMHPEYLTTKWALAQNLPVTQVQHHHAHIVSAMAENGLDEAVCGIAFDGTGYGPDGAIWGGEVLLSNRRTYERFANFAYFPLPGGAAAIKHPLRTAYGALWSFDLLDHPAAVKALEPLAETAALCAQMVDQGINCPETGSVGRLFDAAAALLGVSNEALYEGEPAISLEAAMGQWAESFDEDLAPTEYNVALLKNSATAESTALDTSVVLFDAAPVFEALLDDLQAGVEVALISRRFHDAFVRCVVMAAQLVDQAYGIRTVVLSGGVFMNRYLVEHCARELRRAGFTVALNKDLPPNDACISFGQAVVCLANNEEE